MSSPAKTKAPAKREASSWQAPVAAALVRLRVLGAPGVDHAREIAEVVRHRGDERQELPVVGLLARQGDEPRLARELGLDPGRGAFGDGGVRERERAAERTRHDAEPLALVPGHHLPVELDVARRHRTQIPARHLLHASDRRGEAPSRERGPGELADALVHVRGHEGGHGGVVRGEEKDEVVLGVLSLAPSRLDLRRPLQRLQRRERRLHHERPRRRVLHLLEEQLGSDAGRLTSRLRAPGHDVSVVPQSRNQSTSCSPRSNPRCPTSSS